MCLFSFLAVGRGRGLKKQHCFIPDADSAHNSLINKLFVWEKECNIVNLWGFWKEHSFVRSEERLGMFLSILLSDEQKCTVHF